MSVRASRFVMRAAVSLAALGAAHAHAQGQTAPAPAAAAEAEEPDEILVTARRRVESLAEVPTAITAFSADQIDRLNIRGIDDVAALTPGLQSADSAVSSGGSISLRGVGSGSTNYLGEQAVSINIDGMQVGTLNVRKTAQIDLAQVEVLRGPQALFFGKNSPGGVVSMRTADPKWSQEFEAEAGVEAVSGDRYLQAIASGPLSDKVALRVVGRYTDLNGYFRLKTVTAPGDPLVFPPAVGEYPVGREYFARGTLLIQPSETLKLNAKLSYNHSYNRGGSLTAFQRIDCPYGAPQLQPNFPCVADRDIYVGSAPAGFVSAIPRAERVDGLGFRRNTQWLATLQADLTVAPDVTATYVAGYYKFDEMNAHDASLGPRSLLLVPFLPFEMTQYTQELRLASDWSRPLNFTVGAFYESRNTYGAQDAIVTFFPPAPFAIGTEETFQDQKAVSAFGQLIWRPVPSLELSGGVRYSSEDKSLRFLRGRVDVTGNLARHSLSFGNWSPEATASLRVSPDAIVFASYKQGFKSGGFDAGFTNGAIAVAQKFANTYNDENVEGVEGGLKFSTSALSLNLVAYRYDYDDLQVGAYDAQTISFKVLNAARARVQGLEVDARWRTPARGLVLQGSAALNDAKFRRFLSGCYVGQTPALGCNRTPDPTTGAFQEQDLSGRRINNAPAFTGVAGFVYTTGLSDAVTADFAFDANYSSSFSNNLRQSPQDRQGAFAKLNASIRLYGPDDAWQVSVVGRNLTNRYTVYATGPVTFTGLGSGAPGALLADVSGFVSRGRELFLSVTLRSNILR